MYWCAYLGTPNRTGNEYPLTKLQEQGLVAAMTLFSKSGDSGYGFLIMLDASLAGVLGGGDGWDGMGCCLCYIVDRFMLLLRVSRRGVG